MPKRKTATDDSSSSSATGRRAVVAARVVPQAGGAAPQVSPQGPSPSANPGFGWNSLLSGLPGEPDEEDHEGWVERLFGNERSGCTSPPNAGLLGAEPPLPSPSKTKRGRGGGPRAGRRGPPPGPAPPRKKRRPARTRPLG